MPTDEVKPAPDENPSSRSLEGRTREIEEAKAKDGLDKPK